MQPFPDNDSQYCVHDAPKRPSRTRRVGTKSMEADGDLKRMDFDLPAAIMAAKLGRYRKEAQVDTCAVFAAALYDVLKECGIPCQMFTATPTARWSDNWYHCVVKVGQTYYDSMGEFSEEIYRTREKIHPKVKLDITYKRDPRTDCYEAEFSELHTFYVTMLRKSIDKIRREQTPEIRNPQDQEQNPTRRP